MNNFKQSSTFIESCEPTICPEIESDFSAEELEAFNELRERVEKKFKEYQEDKEAFTLKVKKFIQDRISKYEE